MATGFACVVRVPGFPRAVPLAFAESGDALTVGDLRRRLREALDADDARRPPYDVRLIAGGVDLQREEWTLGAYGVPSGATLHALLADAPRPPDGEGRSLVEETGGPSVQMTVLHDAWERHRTVLRTGWVASVLLGLLLGPAALVLPFRLNIAMGFLLNCALCCCLMGSQQGPWRG